MRETQTHFCLWSFISGLVKICDVMYFPQFKSPSSSVLYEYAFIYSIRAFDILLLKTFYSMPCIEMLLAILVSMVIRLFRRLVSSGGFFLWWYFSIPYGLTRFSLAELELISTLPILFISPKITSSYETQEMSKSMSKYKICCYFFWKRLPFVIFKNMTNLVWLLF